MRAVAIVIILLFVLTACAKQERQVIGYIQSIHDQNGNIVLQVDLIEWFMGGDAKAANLEDNPECINNPDIGCAPLNGYYIRNPEPEADTFPVSEIVTVRMQTKNPYKIVENEPVSFDDFRDLLTETSHGYQRFRNVPFWLELDASGKVVAIHEQYVP